MIPRQFLLRQDRPDDFDWYRTLLKYRIVKIAVGHFLPPDKLAMQIVELKTAHHVRDLVERSVIAGERTPNFCCGVVAFVSDTFDKKINGFLRCHLLEMKTQ